MTGIFIGFTWRLVHGIAYVSFIAGMEYTGLYISYNFLFTIMFYKSWFSLLLQMICITKIREWFGRNIVVTTPTTRRLGSVVRNRSWWHCNPSNSGCKLCGITRLKLNENELKNHQCTVHHFHNSRPARNSWIFSIKISTSQTSKAFTNHNHCYGTISINGTYGLSFSSAFFFLLWKQNATNDEKASHFLSALLLTYRYLKFSIYIQAVERGVLEG